MSERNPRNGYDETDKKNEDSGSSSAIRDFLESIEDIKSIAASQGNKLTQEEVNMYAGINLDRNQMNAVCAYLNEAGIKVEGFGTDDEGALNGGKAPENMNGGTEKKTRSQGTKEKTGSKGSEEKAKSQETDKKDKSSLVRVVTDDENKKGIPSAEKLRHRSKSLDLYKDEVQSIKYEEDGISDDIYEGLIHGSRESADTLTEKMLARVIEMADSYKDEDVFDEDIISEGNLGLASAVMEVMNHGSDYTLEDGSADREKIRKFILSQARQAMIKMIDSENSQSDLTKEVLTKVNLLQNARDFMKEKIGREPDIYELSEYTGMDREEIQELDRLKGSGADKNEKNN